MVSRNVGKPVYVNRKGEGGGKEGEGKGGSRRRKGEDEREKRLLVVRFGNLGSPVDQPRWNHSLWVVIVMHEG